MQVHRLDANPSRTGEAVPDHVAAAAEDAGFQPEHLHFHADAFIAVDPAAWFDVDLLVLGQFFLENVAVAVQPEDTFLVARAEAIDEESRRAQEHVADALHPVEGVIKISRCRQELMLPNEHGGTRHQVEGKEMARAITREGDLTRTLCLGEEDRHACNHPLEGAFHGANADIQGWILPEHDVVLKVHRHRPIEPGMEEGDQLAVDAVSYARRLCILELGGKKLRRFLHPRTHCNSIGRQNRRLPAMRWATRPTWPGCEGSGCRPAPSECSRRS